VHLRRLWLSENELDTMQGLEHLALEELYLGSNQITELGGLGGTLGRSLRILWVNDNRIRTLARGGGGGGSSSSSGGPAPLAGLEQLRELNLAENRLTSLDGALPHLPALASLNLAGNPIGSLRALLPLRSLPALAELALADPLHGTCPVARLTNYATFVGRHLPRLTELDTCAVADGWREGVEAVYARKGMWYGARIRGIEAIGKRVAEVQCSFGF
jgi:Leucine-rich repeat (LRR) protein